MRPRALVLVVGCGSAIGLCVAIGALVNVAASAAITPEPTALALLGAAASAQPRVAAAAGWTAWSDLKDGHYVLKLRSPAGVISSPAAVAPSGLPFRVALGKRSSGRIEAAYDVCPGAKVPVGDREARIGPGCRIMLLDVAAGTVRKLRLAPHTSSAALPALSRDTLAFVALPKGRARKTSVRIMTVGLAGGAARTRWTGKLRNDSPLQVAIDGKAVAVMWAQRTGEQRVDAQPAPHAKVLTLVVADGDESCCESSSLVSLSLTSPKLVSLLGIGGDDDGNVYWYISRLALKKGAKSVSGPGDSASGDNYLTATSLASDGTRDVVIAGDATHPFGVYAFTP
jgi:hypothetical protein